MNLMPKVRVQEIKESGSSGQPIAKPICTENETPKIQYSIKAIRPQINGVIYTAGGDDNIGLYQTYCGSRIAKSDFGNYWILQSQVASNLAWGGHAQCGGAPYSNIDSALDFGYITYCEKNE